MSDADSDCDDVFTDDSKGYAYNDESKSPPGSDEDGRNLVNRKKRRGIIEKRRRDRINNSLSELRRLVPAAFEKQGSAKLEKAEILQMTVDHLRILHTKGVDLFPSGPFVDYHGLGFRECASEVARYLSGFEGLDVQDPLRLRLTSHLQCYPSKSPAPRFFAAAAPAPPPHVYPLFSRGSSSSSMSVDSPLTSGHRKSSSYRMSHSDIKTQGVRSSPTVVVPPYRPWGAEVAY